MAQFSRPIQDISVTSITGSYIAIDESVASDTDFLYSANGISTTYECLLTGLNAPSLKTGHLFRYRISRTNNGVLNTSGTASSVIVSLYQGASLIASDTSKTAGAWTSYTFTLSQAQAETITDYSDLRLRFSITGGGGSTANKRGVGISWSELETPDGVVAVNTTVNLTLITLATALLSLGVNADSNVQLDNLNVVSNMQNITVDADANIDLSVNNIAVISNDLTVDLATHSNVSLGVLTLNSLINDVNITADSNIELTTQSNILNQNNLIVNSDSNIQLSNLNTILNQNNIIVSSDSNLILGLLNPILSQNNVIAFVDSEAVVTNVNLTTIYCLFSINELTVNSDSNINLSTINILNSLNNLVIECDSNLNLELFNLSLNQNNVIASIGDLNKNIKLKFNSECEHLIQSIGGFTKRKYGNSNIMQEIHENSLIKRKKNE